MELELVIGNKNYSSWSLRPWILLKYYDIPFKETLIPLYAGDYKEKLLKISPAGKVPALRTSSLVIGESLAIMEYLAELFPEKHLWPKDREQRAIARAVSNEMHAGFGNLRKNMPMNLRSSHPGKGLTPEVKTEIQRIDQLWSECRAIGESQGPFLFGEFSIADAMFVPVVMRFHIYGVDLSPVSAAYMNAIKGIPALNEWIEAAREEPYILEAFEIYK